MKAARWFQLWSTHNKGLRRNLWVRRWSPPVKAVADHEERRPSQEDVPSAPGSRQRPVQRPSGIMQGEGKPTTTTAQRIQCCISERAHKPPVKTGYEKNDPTRLPHSSNARYNQGVGERSSVPDEANSPTNSSDGANFESTSSFVLASLSHLAGAASRPLSPGRRVGAQGTRRFRVSEGRPSQQSTVLARFKADG